MQEEFVERAREKIEAEPLVRAAWLGGSLGRGDADRFSDVDLHLLLARGRARQFRDSAAGWLEQLAELVLCRRRFGGLMTNALTTEGLRIDLWLHEEGERLEGYSTARCRVLHDPSQLLLEPTLEAKEPLGPSRAERLLGDLEEFWRCLALLPAVVGRGELIVGMQGLGVELDLVAKIAQEGRGIARETDPKRLNARLPADLREQIEMALSTAGRGIEGMKRSHLALGEIVSRIGPDMARRHGFDYPARLEAATRAYLEREL